MNWDSLLQSAGPLCWQQARCREMTGGKKLGCASEVSWSLWPPRGRFVHDQGEIPSDRGGEEKTNTGRGLCGLVVPVCVVDGVCLCYSQKTVSSLRTNPGLCQALAGHQERWVARSLLQTLRLQWPSLRLFCGWTLRMKLHGAQKSRLAWSECGPRGL